MIVSHFLPATTIVITVDTEGKVCKTEFTNQMVRWKNSTKELFEGGTLGRITAAVSPTAAPASAGRFHRADCAVFSLPAVRCR